MSSQRFIAYDQLQQLLTTLQSQGYDCIGPTAHNNTIHYQSISTVDDLPRGFSDKQTPGSYQLESKNHQRYFAWANGAQAIKPLTFSSHETLWQCKRDEQGHLTFDSNKVNSKPIAIIGVRACDLAALELQKQHFLNQELVDPWFKQRLKNLLLITVHCTHPADTCFCASTGDGPEAIDHFDIALHELDDGFLISANTIKGNDILKALATSEATQQQIETSQQQTIQAINKQTRQLPKANVKNTLLEQLESHHWQEIGKRCLSCGNCTSVCPSCFCHQQHEDVDLSTNTSTHYREWSSCFTHNHGYMAGGSLRSDSATRYRQWLTHKFATWHDQYDRSGCVGCGRCITWCPVGIDVTEEINYFCAGDAK